MFRPSSAHTGRQFIQYVYQGRPQSSSFAQGIPRELACLSGNPYLGNGVYRSCFPAFSSQPCVFRSLHTSALRHDYTLNILPVYHCNSVQSSVHRIGIRHMNSNSKEPPNDENATKKDESSTRDERLQQSSGVSTARNESEEVATKKLSQDNPKLKELVDTVDTTIKQVRTKFNPKEMLYYFLVLTTFAVLVVGPFAARYMKRSDTDYDELDTEDPVADLAVFVRTEFLKDSEASARGGLDSILADLLRSPQIQNAINDLINNILISPQFKRSCSILVKELWRDLLEDPETLKQVIHLLQNAIQDEGVKDAAVQLAADVFGDKEVLDEVVELFQRLGQEPKVQLATQGLLVESAHNTLNDPDILDHSMDFATDVVGDDLVQQTAGEALYNTLSYAVRPTLSVLLAILGTGLIFVSLVAFQHSISPDSQSESLDRALENFEKSGIVQALVNMVTFPWQALVAGKDALFWLLMLPYRAISGTLFNLGRAGNAIVDAIDRCFRWIWNLPITLAQSLLGAIGRALTSTTDKLASVSRNLARSQPGSSLGAFFHHLADNFLATKKGLRQSWNLSNDLAEKGAIAIESAGRQLHTVFLGSWRSTVERWGTIKATTIQSSQLLRTRWVVLNRSVADSAVAAERKIDALETTVTSYRKQVESIIKSQGGAIGAISHNTFNLSGRYEVWYGKLNSAAERLGFFVQGVVDAIVWKR